MDETSRQVQHAKELGIAQLIEQYKMANYWAMSFYNPETRGQYVRLCEFLRELVEYFPEEDRLFFEMQINE